MSQCTCPVAGYCERHQVEKHEHWHNLCQTREDYFAAWENGRGPGQKQTPEERAARQQRVREATAAKQHLIEWLRESRIPEDRGVGDTAQRILKLIKKPSDERTAVGRLLKQCSCSRTDAVAMLNQQYSY